MPEMGDETYVFPQLTRMPDGTYTNNPRLWEEALTKKRQAVFTSIICGLMIGGGAALVLPWIILGYIRYCKWVAGID